MNYTRSITIRCTPEERSNLKRRAAKFNMKESDFFRYLMSGETKNHPFVVQELSKLSKEINYIGHNINQIVYRYNEGSFGEEDKKHLIAAMQEVILLEQKVVKNLGSNDH